MAAPYEVVQAVFDRAVATSTALSNSAAAQIASINGQISGLTLPTPITVTAPVVPSVGAPGYTAAVLDAYSLPSTTLITDNTAGEYGSALAGASSAIATQLSTFFATYFPMALNGTELTLAQGWVTNVLSGGGAMNPTIENQYWQRDRDRIAREAAVKESEVTTNWAARGFPLPPGAAVGAVLAIQRSALEQASQSSREVAIKKYETEVLLQQEAVKLAISLRQTAIASMVEFIRALVTTPRENAVAYANVTQQATAAANSALTSYFSATTQANISLIDAKARVAISNASNSIAAGQAGVDAALKSADLQLRASLGVTDIAVRQNETAGNWRLTIAGKKVDAALAAAQMAATQASAALNGIHATAGVSGSDSTSTQFYG